MAPATGSGRGQSGAGGADSRTVALCAARPHESRTGRLPPPPPARLFGFPSCRGQVSLSRRALAGLRSPPHHGAAGTRVSQSPPRSSFTPSPLNRRLRVLRFSPRPRSEACTSLSARLQRRGRQGFPRSPGLGLFTLRSPPTHGRKGALPPCPSSTAFTTPYSSPSTSSPTAPRGPVSPPSNLSPRGFFRSLIPRPRALPAPYLLTEPSMSLSPPPFSPSKPRPPGSQQPPNRGLVIPPPQTEHGAVLSLPPPSRHPAPPGPPPSPTVSLLPPAAHSTSRPPSLPSRPALLPTLGAGPFPHPHVPPSSLTLLWPSHLIPLCGRFSCSAVCFSCGSLLTLTSCSVLSALLVFLLCCLLLDGSYFCIQPCDPSRLQIPGIPAEDSHQALPCWLFCPVALHPHLVPCFIF